MEDKTEKRARRHTVELSEKAQQQLRLVQVKRGLKMWQLMDKIAEREYNEAFGKQDTPTPNTPQEEQDR